MDDDNDDLGSDNSLGLPPLILCPSPSTSSSSSLSPSTSPFLSLRSLLSLSPCLSRSRMGIMGCECIDEQADSSLN